ncbi:U7 snRNA-associated Sm-like protein LSm11 [Genypterus blacodes]|uniref:U7 snRNA-associated Sm-like protein LSm11 n=1 Tax=Genypterus blacodes TaxID=154954 RepID=UPI003F75A130
MEERERKSMKASSSGADSENTAPASGSNTPLEPNLDPDTGREVVDRLDVCSDNFDPLLALYSPSVPLPFPTIKCFNNVAEYESFLKGGRGRAKPENVEKKLQKARKGVADPERLERLKKLMVNNPVTEPKEGESSAPPRRKRDKPRKNVLTRMTLCKGCPLAEMYRCVEERIRVKVHIRTFKGLRGVCSGFIVAFDKFWNMALVDVDETYREPLLGEALNHEKALTISRLFEKLKIQESPAGDEQAKTQETQPESKSASKRPEPPRPRGHSRMESKVSTDDVITEQGKHGAPPKAPGAEAAQKKGSQAYGKVHTRHINQLFIRGENIVLVNPQPL